MYYLVIRIFVKFCSFYLPSQEQPEPFRTIIEVIVHSLVNKMIVPPSKSHDSVARSHDHQEAVKSDPITYSSLQITDTTIEANSSQQAQKKTNPNTSTTTGFQSTSTTKQSATSSTKNTASRSIVKGQSAMKPGSISSTAHSGHVMQAGHRAVRKRLKSKHLSSDFEFSTDQLSDSLLNDTSGDLGVRSPDSLGSGVVARQSGISHETKTLFGELGDLVPGGAGGKKVSRVFM